jgi:hypothetical protein
MAISLVQNVLGSLSSGTTKTITISPNTGGNLLVVLSANFDNDDMVGQLNIVSVTDNQGNSYTSTGTAAVFFDSTTLNPGTTDIWYAQNTIGGVTSVIVTFDVAVTHYAELVVQEYSGIALVGALETGASFTTGATPGNNAGPMLTSASNGNLFLSVCNTGNHPVTGVTAPWTYDNSGTFGFAHYVEPVAGTEQALFTGTQPNQYCSSGVVFLKEPPTIILTLSDSVSFSDSTVKEDETTLTDSLFLSDMAGVGRGQSVSDSMAITDSFSLQSSSVVVVPTPTVETLVNQLVPAEVKTFFEIE